MTITATGEVVVYIDKPCGDEHEVRWYGMDGKLLYSLPRPVSRQDHFRILAVMVNRKQQIALSNHRCIWLGSPDTGKWVKAWQATGDRMKEGREYEPTPRMMFHGRPGQIIVENEWYGSVSVFDITQIPFRVEGSEVKLDMEPKDLCYCELPGIGDAIAVTDGYYGIGKIGMFNLDSGVCLWRLSGLKGRGGIKWTDVNLAPGGICCDNMGRLYVADEFNNRIIVLSAASGSVLQVVQGRGHWDNSQPDFDVDPGITVYGPDVNITSLAQNRKASGTVLQEFKHLKMVRPQHVCWHEGTKSLIVCYNHTEIIHFKLEF